MKKVLLFIIIFSIIFIAGSLIAKAQLVEIPDPLNCDGHCDLLGIINKIIDFLKIIVIPLAALMIIISGIQYLISAGNEEKVRNAKKTMLYAVIGVAIVLAVDFIVGLIQEILQRTTT